ncbi:MAG: hypothetical protein HC836_13855 [Richelia sp. RM2_1_2]|nr:hypothetical protein [Richelia sp. RM2_1_2]
MNTRTNRIQVLVNQKELTKLKSFAKNASLSSYLRKSGLRQKQQISNNPYQDKVKAIKSEIQYHLQQAKLVIKNGNQHSIENIDKLIEITDKL